MIKLVAFDWNGTIFADTHAIFESDNQIFKLLNLKPVSFQIFQKYFDVPVKNFYMALGISEKTLDEKLSQIANIFHENYEKRATKLRSRKGAKEVLEWLLKNNIDSIIFSNHIIEPIRKQLKRLKLEKYFTEVIANSHLESALKSRGKGERLRDYIKLKSILPKEIVIIGDNLEEIEIGKEFGITTVAITEGNCSTARLRNAKPDHLINSLTRIIKIISKINQAR